MIYKNQQSIKNDFALLKFFSTKPLRLFKELELEFFSDLSVG